MRKIEWTGQFKRDFKREKKSHHQSILESALMTVVQALAEDRPLEAKCCDHGLGGRCGGCRDCHIRPDLLLIYEKEEGVLRLIRLGSHAEIGF